MAVIPLQLIAFHISPSRVPRPPLSPTSHLCRIDLSFAHRRFWQGCKPENRKTERMGLCARCSPVNSYPRFLCCLVLILSLTLTLPNSDPQLCFGNIDEQTNWGHRVDAKRMTSRRSVNLDRQISPGPNFHLLNKE